ncbi:MAG: acyl-CoA reductase [Rikenellaceae bacterium]|nr:acyl-CoA reductase [Rikenellaceae bacterium]MCL2691833.1 acyl-CoA reductase [Rikenellaceae bacterium]
MTREKLTDIFAALGERLKDFGATHETAAVIERATAANGWFTRADIVRAVEAIRSRMLERAKLEQWLADYPQLPVARPRTVGVIMAGNLPLVGFFDLLCTLTAGHACRYKPAAKDSVLTDYIVAQLREVWPQVPVEKYTDQPLDAVIATGGDNAWRVFRARFGGIPAIFRGNRTSVALLAGDETTGELEALAEDVFSYSGLGCRNVSKLLLPRGYDVARLVEALDRHPMPNDKYRNNFVQRSAVLRMQQIDHISGSFFLLREDKAFPSAISEITFSFYDTREEALAWLTAHDDEIQCVVGRRVTHPRSTEFGGSQSPTLLDYPDGADVMQFLSEI